MYDNRSGWKLAFTAHSPRWERGRAAYVAKGTSKLHTCTHTVELMQPRPIVTTTSLTNPHLCPYVRAIIRLTSTYPRPWRPKSPRSSLGCSLPSLPPRPAVSRLRDEGDEADDVPPSEAELQRRREENIRALVNNRCVGASVSVCFSVRLCVYPRPSVYPSVCWEGEGGNS